MKNIINNRLLIGTFNAEKDWRNSTLAILPFVRDSLSENIVSTLDELQFVFCNDTEDILFTRYKIGNFQLDYLSEIGFNFKKKSFYNEINESDSKENICKLLLGESFKNDFTNFGASSIVFSPYAVDEYSSLLCTKFGLQCDLPDAEIVKKVNSKFFSFEILKNIYPVYNGIQINSSELLLQRGTKLLQDTGPFLIKDGFGVSGNGNLLINSKDILKNICRYLAKQEKGGKESQFILEPFYQKDCDFSCQFELNKNGELKFDSIQVMQNKAFSFLGIEEAQSEFFNHLEMLGYFNYMEKIASYMHHFGYFGPVCVDSMSLQNGSLMPLIEINARRSMGLINSNIKKQFKNLGLNTCLYTYSLGIPENISYKLFFNKLHEQGILFNSKNNNGIIPLSSVAFDINQNNNLNSVRKGRLYVAFMYDVSINKTQLMGSLERIFTELNIRNYV